MSLILNIDTALESGSVSLSQNGNLITTRTNANQRDHAGWLHTAIDEMVIAAGCHLKDLKAVAVSNGPGSYTGLRIGLSAAKGFCYALNIPLITIGTLEIMATHVVEQPGIIEDIDWLCPMIDARRMEVYFAIYDKSMNQIISPRAAILDQHSYTEFLAEKKILFFGNGNHKLKKILHHDHAFSYDFDFLEATSMSSLSLQYYDNAQFADIAYSEPLYIKDFHGRC